MSKKIFIISVILGVIISNSVFGCSFHQMLPQGSGAEYIDTKYIEYNVAVPDYIEYDQDTIPTYMYLIIMKDYVWIENAISLMPGLYVVNNEEIENIEQDTENPNFVNITLKDGSVLNLDTVLQENNEENIFYLHEKNGLEYIDVKPEYLYIYSEELVETADSEIADNKSIDSETDEKKVEKKNPLSVIEEEVEVRDETINEAREELGLEVYDNNAKNTFYFNEWLVFAAFALVFTSFLFMIFIKNRREK